ncbi:hypothetical protein JD844_005641, partial [Phrynosoma platyrhinos]
YQLYRDHLKLPSESSDTSSSIPGSGAESQKNILYSTSSLPCTLDSLQAGFLVPEKAPSRKTPLTWPSRSSNPSVPVDLNICDEVSWTGPRNGELISFYELQLQEAKLDGQGKNIHWFCSQTEEHLENLTPDTKYLIRFGTMAPVQGMPLDPSPVTVTVRRSRKSQKKTIFLPAP